MTAAQLLAALTRAGCRPTIDGPDVVFAADPPGELARPLAVLLTGVRALLMGQRWHGIDPRTGHACGPRPAGGCGPLAFGALDPAAKLPRTVGLLCVEAAGEEWDRLPPGAANEFPELFDSPP